MKSGPKIYAGSCVKNKKNTGMANNGYNNHTCTPAKIISAGVKTIAQRIPTR